MIQPKSKPCLDSIERYVGGKSKTASQQSVIKLSSNENPLGPSPRAIEAYQGAATSLFRYPEDAALSLRETIEQHVGFAADQIVCTTGSDEAFNLLIHAYAGPGENIVYSAYGFLMYKIFASHYGVETIAAPEKDFTTDVDSILDVVNDQTRLVFIANPNNPTGSYINRDQIHALREQLREDIILVLDGAYSEYMEADDYSDGCELVKDTNTVLTRTFSKVYGLPALRLGYAYGPKHIIKTLYKVRPPFNITQPAIAAGIAALNDTAYLQETVRENNQQRELLSKELAALGCNVLPSHANFVMLSFANHTPAEINHALLERGIITRELNAYGLSDYLRISIGTAEENKALLAALKAMLA